MGDEDLNISEGAVFLIMQLKVKPLTDIPNIAGEARKILKNSPKSFTHEDTQLARSLR